MILDFYLIFSSLICVALVIFIITFGLPFFTGAPFAVSTRYKIDKMLPFVIEAMAGRKNLQAVDLGSGDGRIVIALARAGLPSGALAKDGLIASGIEINPFLAWFSRLKIRASGLKGKAFIRRESFWHSDFSQYDIVVLFGVFYIMKKLEQKLLAEMKPGAIVICNHFYFPTWQPMKQEDDIYVYKKIPPLIKEGSGGG